MRAGQQAGTVDGVPLATPHFFLGMEHPASKNIIIENRKNVISNMIHGTFYVR